MNPDHSIPAIIALILLQPDTRIFPLWFTNSHLPTDAWDYLLQLRTSGNVLQDRNLVQIMRSRCLNIPEA